MEACVPVPLSFRDEPPFVPSRQHIRCSHEFGESMHRLGTPTIQDAANDTVKLPDVDDNLRTQAEGVVPPTREFEPPRPQPPHRRAKVSVGSLLRRLRPERAADPASVYRASSEGQEREHSLSGTRKRDR